MSDKPTIVLLPGMDGTGELFQWLAPLLEPELRVVIVSYPNDHFIGYGSLAERVAHAVPPGPHAVLAESFSGPVAVAVASRRPKGLRGVILSTSFVARPGPRWLARAPIETLLGIAPATFVLPRLLLGGTVATEVRREVLRVIRGAPRALLARRLREVLRVDSTEALARCAVPLAYLAASRDRLIGKRCLRAIQRCRPDIDSLTLEGPHLLLQARPREAARAILERTGRWFAG